MKPGTFAKIKKESGEDAAGAAYQQALNAKYKKHKQGIPENQ